MDASQSSIVDRRSSRMIPAEVIELLQTAFPGQQIGDLAPTSGGFSNITAHVTIGDERCVVKAATAPIKRADVRREARVLAQLHASGLPIPALLALAEDEHWTVAVTRFVAGEHGLRVLQRAPTELEPLYSALGRLLAAVHRTPLAAADPTLRLAERAEQIHAIILTLGLEAGPGEPLIASLEHPVWRSQPGGLVHGDAGLHNLLWDGRITALLDWEWAGLGSPLLDLAWLYWTMRWRDLPPALWRTFLAGYSGGPALACGGSPEALRALALGQIVGILARVQEQPAAREEWLRRLRWTLGMKFPVLENA
jgi:aminoglycoside phosphotransferase (APT) family kinase protein